MRVSQSVSIRILFASLFSFISVFVWRASVNGESPAVGPALARPKTATFRSWP